MNSDQCLTHSEQTNQISVEPVVKSVTLLLVPQRPVVSGDVGRGLTKPSPVFIHPS